MSGIGGNGDTMQLLCLVNPWDDKFAIFAEDHGAFNQPD
jgi:hypothetical protein